MRSVEEQLATITANAAMPAPVRIAISESLGLLCAEDVVAERPLPGFVQSAIDGYAVRSVDVRGESGETLAEFDELIDPYYGAPTVLIVLAERVRATYLLDGASVMTTLVNAAHAVGLGSCWIHRAKEMFESEEGKALLQKWGVEGDYEGIGHCVLGYAADAEAKPAAPRKKNYIYHI